MVTLTTPSECPVTITFWVSHSFISETQQHRICWLRPVKVLALAMGLPLMLHMCMYVPAHDTISPYTNINTYISSTAFDPFDVSRISEYIIWWGLGELSSSAHRQFIDAQSRDGRPVSPELCHKWELVEIPDDAGSIPRAADNNAVRRWRCQTRYSVCVTQ